MCYLYTNPLYALIEAHIYYMEKFKKVKGVFKKISPLFLTPYTATEIAAARAP